MYAVFRHQAFSHFVNLADFAASGAPLEGEQTLLLSEEHLLRLRAIYRSGFAAAATQGPGALLTVLATTERRPVPVRVRVHHEEGGGMGQVPDLHTYSQEKAGEKVADELEKVSRGRVQLAPAQAEARAQAAVADLLVIHPAPTRPHLLEAFQGLWTAAHVDMRAPLAEGLRTALTNLKERGVSKQVEKALVAATVQRNALAA